MNVKNITTCDRIKQIRHNRHMTQAEFADLIGISRAYYSHIENGTSNITDTVLQRISIKFNLPIDYLIGNSMEILEEKGDINRKIVYKLPEIRVNRRMKELRESRGLSTMELSQVLGVSERIYTKYEQGDFVPDIEILIKLSYFYNISADWLLGITEKTNIQEAESFLDSISGEICSDADADEIMELLTFSKGVVLYFAGNELAHNEEWKKATQQSYDKTNKLMSSMKKECTDCHELINMLFDYDAVKDQIKNIYGHASYLNGFKNGIKLMTWAAGRTKAKDTNL